MYYASVKVEQVYKEAAGYVEGLVQEQTGLSVQVLQYPNEKANTTPLRMLHVIALTLDLSPECYRLKTRIRPIVEMRFIASVLLRQYFPGLTLQQIAKYFGGQDHSSVINAISRANELIYVRDAPFMKKYNKVMNTVTKWLQKETFGYALPASA